MKKVVVTGATSMMGSALIRSLLNHDVEIIYAIVQTQSKNMHKLPIDNRVHCIRCDCENYDSLPELIPDRCDVFYHFAWIHSLIKGRERYFDVEVGYQNVGQSLNALESAKKLGCKTFVGAGSQAEYGNRRNDIQKPEDSTDPITAYAIAKDCTRRMCMLKAKEYAIDVQWVRIFSVYGPNDRENTLISQIIPKLKNNEDIKLTQCKQIWEYLYEDDAGEGLYYAGLAEGSNIFCLGSGDAKPLKIFIEELKKITKSNSSISYGSVLYTDDAVMNLHADVSELKEKTGWLGPQVSFKEGIIRIINLIK